MSFGFATAVDALSWAVVALLGAKVAATAMLLCCVRAGQTACELLWWSTKIAPLLAVPCLIAVAMLQGHGAEAGVYAVLLVFAAVAVPAMAWRRRRATADDRLSRPNGTG